MIDAPVALLFLAGIWAGAQNALAGGGSFVTIPALMAAGLDARVANLTSTVAVFPGQITTALANRRLVSGVGPFDRLRNPQAQGHSELSGPRLPGQRMPRRGPRWRWMPTAQHPRRGDNPPR